MAGRCVLARDHERRASVVDIEIRRSRDVERRMNGSPLVFAAIIFSDARRGREQPLARILAGRHR